ncbi:hypothetical protein [Streptomyces aculeolatus]|uniref:hypothetical protein n=1 Tax=Streptomyces aculeolatus TaxID=270689 RepID=UPI001CED2409|nr:hypothetical protein [Streptomyces aculeolatus]
MNYAMTAAERVAQIRTAAAGAVASYRDKVAFHIKNQNTESLEAARRDLAHAEAEAKTLDGLSDLEVLNRVCEEVMQERITVNDRYMGLLVEQRKYGERVRAGVMREVRDRLDMLACHAVSRKTQELTAVLTAVDALPERANAERIAQLKRIASGARHGLRVTDGTQGEDPTRSWRLDDNRALVHAARSVLGVLRDKPEVSADDVIRLVGEALTPNGNLRELFEVAGPTPAQPKPVFLTGAHWHDGGTFCAYEPPSGARVVAYNVGDAWHLDLHAATGALLAYGSADIAEVAELAPALAARAAEWAVDRSGYGWQRFAEVAEQRRRVAA